MSSGVTLRRPEYTGENRCWPCTGVNVAIVAVLGLVVAVLAGPAVALPVLSVGLAAVWLRGYVVPYTPRFAPPLVAHIPGLSDPKPSDRLPGSLAAGEADPDAVLPALVDAGVLTVSAERVEPAPSFAAAWADRIDELSADSPTALPEAVREQFPTVRDVELLTPDGDPWLVVTDAAGEEVWLSEPVAIAELAALAALAAVAPDLDDGVRSLAPRPLRAFLTSCPACDGPVVELDPRNCCGGYRDRTERPESVLACGDCDRQLYAIPAD